MPITPKNAADPNIVVEWAPCDRNEERKALKQVYRQELVKRSQLMRIAAAWVASKV